MTKLNKLNILIMGQDCEKTIETVLESVKDTDTIIYVDGGSTDKTIDILEKRDFSLYGTYNKDKVIIKNEFNKEDPEMISKQRNFYLDYLKRIHTGEWVLCLDADEILDDEGVKKIKEFIKNPEFSIYNVKMRHLIYSLKWEDATIHTHFVPARLFKIKDDLYYPEGEHSTLREKDSKRLGNYLGTTIWHLAYCEGIWAIEKRYKQQKERRSKASHNIKFLNDWRNSHLFGNYPIREINPIDLPSTLLNRFDIDKDELYFKDRGVEIKHFIMMRQWLDYIKSKKQGRIDIVDFGCGRAPYGYAFKTIHGDWGWPTYKGIELSNWAVNNAFVPIEQGDITTAKPDINYSLVLCIDILEHLNNKDLNKSLINIKNFGDDFIFSIPFKGDPNLENDPTHKQFRTKEEWIKLIEGHGIKIKETPKDWLFSNQILIGSKNA